MWVVIITFIVTILLWVIPKDVTGIDTNTVSMIPMAIFAITGVITAKDMQEINWSVIWMVAGGFAIGLGMNGSGLADAAIESIPFGNWSPIVILAISGLICYFLSNFISNTATAALLVPILAVVCRGMGRQTWWYWRYKHRPYRYCHCCLYCNVSPYLYTTECYCLLNRTCQAE